ncbi:MAG: sulfatase [Cyclobacteriaceae bacterium]
MKFFSILFLLLSIFSASPCQKPNILWVAIEDTSPQFIGCYGNKNARTPVIDALASEGVRFTNAFSTGTVCSPSRFTIITGVRTHNAGTGNHRSQFPIPEFINGFPFYLRQEGYYVTNNRKTDYNLAGEKEFIERTWNESSDKAGWWNRTPGQPFFAVFNFEDSHQSRTMTHPYEWYQQHVLEQLPEDKRIGDNDFEMPPFYNDSPAMRKQFARVYNSIQLTDNKIGVVLTRLKNDNLMDSTIIFFYGDHGQGIPRGKTNGIDLGHRVPFVIWFPPLYRHLSPWGTQVVSDELITFEDLAPTLINLAGGKVPDHLNGRILFGANRSVPVSKVFLSNDRSDNGIDMVRSVTNGRYFYSRNFMPYMPEGRYIRYMEISDIKQIMRKDLAANRLNALQKSLFEFRPAESLYDIEQDPWQTRNLAGDPTALSLLNGFRTAFNDNILTSRDIMFLTEYEMGLISKYTTPYEFRLDKAKYPLEEIYASASLSGMRGKDIARQQIALLKNPDKIIRYWAITGLRSQDKTILDGYKSKLKEAMNDSYPPVAITASAISYDLFNDKSAEANLKKYCQHENAHLALMTINFLLYVQNPVPFIGTIKEVYSNKETIYHVSSAAKDFLGRLGHIPNNFENR